jgi:hypothetical protein
MEYSNIKTLQPEINWKPWQRIIFRFSFAFFILETLTELVTGNWFGPTTVIWELGEKIYTPSLVWINNHLFHFAYKPEGNWTTLTGSLTLVRHIVFFISSIVVCFLWTFFDKRAKHYNKLNFWFSKGLRVVLACTMFCYGMIKCFPVQMREPTFTDLHKTLGELSPFDLLWNSFGYAKPYQMVSGMIEVMGAIFILFRRTAVIGLLLLCVVLINVILLNYVFVVGVLDLSVLLFIISLYLLHPYLRALYGFFLKEQLVFLPQPVYNGSSKPVKYILPGAAILLVLVSFTLNTIGAYQRYTTAETVNRSKKYSAVKKFSIDNNSLKPFAGDTICWQFWSERVVKNKLLVTVATMDAHGSKSYALTRDSINHLITLLPLLQKDTTAMIFHYKDIDRQTWYLEGDIKGKRIMAELQKIDPDTTLTLLKTKRTFLNRDNDTE